jgi:hypothetical protein
MNPKLQRILHPRATRRAARVEKFLQTESIEYQGVARSNVSAPGVLESKLLPVRLDYLRSLMQARIDIRKRLGQECPDLLLGERLDRLEEEMIRAIDNCRQEHDSDYKRRAAASGIPGPRSPYRDDAEYGDVVGLVRRGVGRLKLRRELGRGKDERKWSRGDTIAAWALGVAIVVGVIAAILAVAVPEARRWVGLDKPEPTQVQGAPKK